MPPQLYVVHPTDLQYAPTVMRAPSPSSTIGTDYGPDETTMVDAELSESEFERKCEDAIGLHNPRAEEEEASRDPLVLPRPSSRHKLTPAEENQMFEQVMNNLRAAVKKLEEDELFDHTRVKSAAAALEDPPPSSDDIDVIMSGLMNVSTSSPTYAAPGTGSSMFFNSRSETVTPQWGYPANASMHWQSSRP